MGQQKTPLLMSNHSSLGMKSKAASHVLNLSGDVKKLKQLKQGVTDRSNSHSHHHQQHSGSYNVQQQTDSRINEIFHERERSGKRDQLKVKKGTAQNQMQLLRKVVN